MHSYRVIWVPGQHLAPRELRPRRKVGIIRPHHGLAVPGKSILQNQSQRSGNHHRGGQCYGPVGDDAVLHVKALPPRSVNVAYDAHRVFRQ